MLKIAERILFSPERENSLYRHYLLPVGLTGLALGIRMAIAPVGAGLQYVTFFPAVTLSAIAGGYRAGLFSTALGLAFATFFFMPPYHSFSLQLLHASLWSNLVFLFDGIIVSFSIEALYRYHQKYSRNLVQTQAVQNALESTYYLKTILDNLSSSVVLLDPDGVILEVNRLPLDQMRLHREDLIGRRMVDLEVFSYDKKVQSQVEEATEEAKQGQARRFNIVLKMGNNLVPSDFTIAPFRDQTGRIVGLILSAIELSSSESYMNTLIEAVPAALFLKDAEGRWLKVNRAGLDLFDLFGKDWQNRTDIELSRDYPRYREALETCRIRDLEAWEHGKPTVAIEIVPQEDGTLLQLETTKIPVRNPDGSPLGLVVSAYDLTERLRFEELLGRYQRIFESAAEGILIADADKAIIDVNPAFSYVTGYSREEVLGRNPRILHSGRQTEEFYRAMWKSIETRGSWEGEILNRRKSGEIYCEHLEINSLVQDGHVTHYVGIFSDITRRKEDEERLVHLAFHDTLTDLPNRRTFKLKIEETLARASRNPGCRFAVGILDLDGFKEVNDRLGHPAGDDLLVQVSGRLKSVFRETDTLSRLGGDEFGLLLPEIENEEAFFDRIMKTLREPFGIGSEQVTISGSLGATFFPPDRPDADLLLSHADLALYRVKTRGRNGWAPFQQEMEEAIELRHLVLTEFERALSKGELLLHYQPQVKMTTGEVVGVEALVRWNHPERGLLLPSEFIDVVEKSELIASLGHFVLKDALAQQKRWKEEGLNLRISVNIGARHFLSESFQEDLERVAACHGSCPMTLELEVTETEALKDLSQAQAVIEKCRILGVAVSLDDFGTGQASLTSLQNLSVGEIKIDQGFALKVRTSQKDRAIVSSLVVVGRLMEIDVMVEGVETEEDGRALIDMGCELAQGYGIARPMPAEAIPEWIATWKPFESWTRKTLPDRDRGAP